MTRARVLATVLLLGLAACTTPPAGNLVRYRAVADSIPGPLTGQPAAAADGARVFVSRGGGHCVLCHRVATLDTPFQGDLGPDLTSIGARLTAGQLRLRIVDASLLNPTTVMPPYYRTSRLTQVAREHVGQPALSALQIEQLVAFLALLRP